ncbi:MAG: glutamate racemase [Bdellovibrio sp.]|nr:glutamate racemase [Bdellovibrio sp.]
MKIGVFDSGVGGLTVLAELKKRLPLHLSYVYLGDTAHVPYGPKSSAQIQKLSLDAVEILKAKKVDALVVACNTAASHAMSQIEARMNPIPVFGVVEPGVVAALDALRDLPKKSPVVVFATKATVRSRAYSLALESRDAGGPIYEQACPLLVPIIEEGWIDHAVLHQTIREYVSPYLTLKPGVALLGCTHYPWIHQAFEKALPGWRVVNSAWAVAHFLEQSGWFQAKVSQSKRSQKSPHIEWIFTDPDAVPEFARKWIQNE